MCCCGFMSKYLLFFFNAACSFASVACVVLGILVMVDFGPVVECMPVNLKLAGISIIAFGCIAFLVFGIGCWGTFTENRFFLVLYCGSMVILAVLEAWLAITLLVKYNALETTFNGWLTNASYLLEPPLDQSFHFVESSFQCCGTNGTYSYLTQNNGTLDHDEEVPKTANGTNVIPGSCCGLAVTVTCKQTDAFEGCNKVITRYLSGQKGPLAWSLFGAIAIEMAVIVMVFCLSNSISQKSSLFKLPIRPI